MPESSSDALDPAAAVQEVPFTVTSARDDAVHGDVRFVPDTQPRPVVVFCHGFKGFKDWGPFPAWGRRLARAGFVSVLFNFSHNGVTPEAPTAFTDLEAFANNTFTRELDDLRAVLDAVDRRMLPEAAPVDPGRIGLMGHSRGGGTAVLQAARDERVWALATWSAVAHFVERFTDAQVEDWRTQGYTTVQNSRTGQTMRMNRVLYDDAQAHRRALDIPAAAAAIERPWLVVHARDDDSVAFEAAETLAEAGGETATLLPAEGGHTFGGAHPHDGAVPETLETVWKRTQAFFREHL